MTTLIAQNETPPDDWLDGARARLAKLRPAPEGAATAAPDESELDALRKEIDSCFVAIDRDIDSFLRKLAANDRQDHQLGIIMTASAGEAVTLPLLTENVQFRLDNSDLIEKIRNLLDCVSFRRVNEEDDSSSYVGHLNDYFDRSQLRAEQIVKGAFRDLEKFPADLTGRLNSIEIFLGEADLPILHADIANWKIEIDRRKEILTQIAAALKMATDDLRIRLKSFARRICAQDYRRKIIDPAMAVARSAGTSSYFSWAAFLAATCAAIFTKTMNSLDISLFPTRYYDVLVLLVFVVTYALIIRFRHSRYTAIMAGLNLRLRHDIDSTLNKEGYYDSRMEFSLTPAPLTPPAPSRVTQFMQIMRGPKQPPDYYIVPRMHRVRMWAKSGLAMIVPVLLLFSASMFVNHEAAAPATASTSRAQTTSWLSSAIEGTQQHRKRALIGVLPDGRDCVHLRGNIVHIDAMNYYVIDRTTAALQTGSLLFPESYATAVPRSRVSQEIPAAQAEDFPDCRNTTAGLRLIDEIVKLFSEDRIPRLDLGLRRKSETQIINQLIDMRGVIPDAPLFASAVIVGSDPLLTRKNAMFIPFQPTNATGTANTNEGAFAAGLAEPFALPGGDGKGQDMLQRLAETLRSAISESGQDIVVDVMGFASTGWIGLTDGDPAAASLNHALAEGRRTAIAKRLQEALGDGPWLDRIGIRSADGRIDCLSVWRAPEGPEVIDRLRFSGFGPMRDELSTWTDAASFESNTLVEFLERAAIVVVEQGASNCAVTAVVNQASDPTGG